MVEGKKEEVSKWWWLLPILLSFVGGIIAWIVNRKKGPKKSRYMLILGFVLLILFVVFYQIVGWPSYI